MIKYENNMLVLDSSHTKEDQLAINTFIEDLRVKQKLEILNKINEIEKQSHDTRTPLYQETLFRTFREILDVHEAEEFPPKRFRDISNGE